MALKGLHDKSRNLPYSTVEVKWKTEKCNVCAVEKLGFVRGWGKLIKTSQPCERLSMDFKELLPSSQGGNKYLLTTIDKYSCFLFAFAH